MSAKQEIMSDATFKVWPLSSYLNFASKDGRVTAATCKHYYPLVVNPTITNCHKNFHLKCHRVPRSIFENIAMHKNQCGSVQKPVVFLIIFKILAPLSKVIVFLCTFHNMMKISLLGGCDHYLVFMDPVNGCSKLKLLVKE